MVNIPRLHLLSRGDDEEERAAHSLGIRTLRKSGGSVVVTIPPEVVELVDMDVGDDVVVHATSDSISLTKLPDQD
ncbi:MAG: AbrB/MazE/SpoVT family DNA-binding domain-containing protein [Haloferacaceae archaeon]